MCKGIYLMVVVGGVGVVGAERIKLNTKRETSHQQDRQTTSCYNILYILLLVSSF
jgi:hypothetical protein